MEKVSRYADENDLVLRLIIMRYGYSDEKAMNNVQLEEFYSKFGFERHDNTLPIFMIRYPTSQKIHAP